MSNFDTSSTDDLICPYCGAEQEDAREQEDWGTPEKWTCCDCCRDFVYTTETCVKFTSEDLGEYLEDKIRQEKDWLKVVQSDYDSLVSKPLFSVDALQKATSKVERVKERISNLEERFNKHCEQSFEDIEND